LGGISITSFRGVKLQKHQKHQNIKNIKLHGILRRTIPARKLHQHSQTSKTSKTSKRQKT